MSRFLKQFVGATFRVKPSPTTRGLGNINYQDYFVIGLITQDFSSSPMPNHYIQITKVNNDKIHFWSWGSSYVYTTKNNYFNGIKLRIMKKKIIIATLIICVVFYMLLSSKEYRNYKITNITLSEIVIKDSLLNLRKGNRYFLLEFMVDYCNSSLTFMGGGIESGLNGTIESIKSIKIIDSNGNDISSLFHNLTIEDNYLWLDDYLVFSKNYNIDSLVNSINHRDRNEIGQRITIPRLFVIDSTSVIPDSIILNFGTHSIISNVKYKKSKPFVLSTSDR